MRYRLRTALPALAFALAAHLAAAGEKPIGDFSATQPLLSGGSGRAQESDPADGKKDATAPAPDKANRAAKPDAKADAKTAASPRGKNPFNPFRRKVKEADDEATGKNAGKEDGKSGNGKAAGPSLLGLNGVETDSPPPGVPQFPPDAAGSAASPWGYSGTAQGGAPHSPDPWQAYAEPPTPEAVEAYRLKLEARLLERYNNLPDFAGQVAKVSVVLSKPLDYSLDGRFIKAEFDQLVYDSWGKRLTPLEKEYFVVTFGSGGTEQVRSDPSVRVGLDLEKNYAERAPLAADPFRNVEKTGTFKPAPAVPMPKWWRPDFPDLDCGKY